jgi:hypothetical protein
MIAQQIETYKILNTFTPDYSLDKQIELGINDWVAVTVDDQLLAYGHSKHEAVSNLMTML